ncbi:MAG: hypothetical protein V3U27_12555, partial [Candidatus Tectomicrobia bacterium]
MRLSYTQVRNLGTGLLMGLMLLVAAAALLNVRRAVTILHLNVEVQARKQQGFYQLTIAFSKAGNAFYRQRASVGFMLREPIAMLDVIRGVFAETEQLPLTPTEQRSLVYLIAEEKRFRAAVYAFAASGLKDAS